MPHTPSKGGPPGTSCQGAGGDTLTDNRTINPSVYKNLKILSPIVRAIGLSPGIKSTVQYAFTALFSLFNGARNGPWGSLKVSPGD